MNYLDKSILDDIKSLLGLTADYKAFDSIIIIHINSVFSSMTQMGIGPKDGFFINDKATIWSSYFEGVINTRLQQQIMSYMGSKVRMLFDPPENGNLMKALEANIAEAEYRLFLENDKPQT